MSTSPNRSSRPDRHSAPEFSRAALVPGILGAVALLSGLALIDNEWFIVIRFAAAILALILCVYAYQARTFWWLLPLAAIAVIWNPAIELKPLDGQGWQFLQLAGAAVFVIAALWIKVPVPPESNSRR